MSSLRELVDRHGWAFSAEQAANHEMRAWTTAEGAAGVAYVTARTWPGGSRVHVAAGDPLAPADALGAVRAGFETWSRTRGADVVWFGASERLRALSPSAELVLGAEPVLRPDAWARTLDAKASLRAQIARARNKDVVVQELGAGESPRALRPVLDAWLATRGMPALHFLAQPRILHAPGARRFWVARRHGTPLAVLSLCPVARRPAALVEWVLRRPDAPNGTSERLIDAALGCALDDGLDEVSLGLVPLSTRAPLTESAPPRAVRAVLAWTRAHARRFYRFDGLERFKAKFAPHRWEPSYLLTTQRQVSITTLYAVADAFAGPLSPQRLVTRALRDAARDELGGLLTRR